MVFIKYKCPYLDGCECGYTRAKLRRSKCGAYSESKTPRRRSGPISEHKFGHGSRRGLKPRMTVLTRATRNLLDRTERKLGNSSFPYLSINLSVYLTPCCSHWEHRASVKYFVCFLSLSWYNPLDGGSARRKADTYIEQHRQNKRRHPCLEWDSNPQS
jgi:hypothetical protein